MPEAFKKNLEEFLIGWRYVGMRMSYRAAITYAILSLNLSPSYPLFCMLSHELPDWFTYVFQVFCHVHKYTLH